MSKGINYWMAERLGRRFYYGWVVAGVAICANLSVFSFSPVFGLFVTPWEQTFGWDRATIGRSLTVATVVIAVLAPGMGYLIDRVGARMLQVCFGVAIGICYALLGAMHSTWQFYTLVAIIYPLTWVGVGQMIGSVNVGRWFVRRRGRAMGIAMMGASGGAVIFIPLCTVLIETLGWRATLMVFGAISTLLVSLPAFFLLVNSPESLGLAGHEELRGPSTASTASTAGTAGAAGGAAPGLAPHGGDWSLRQALRTRVFWMTLFGLMLGTVAVQGYFVHAVPHMESLGFSRILASTVWSTFFLVGVFAKFLWGFVIERIGVRKALLALWAGEATGIYLLLTAETPLALFTYAVINGLGHGPYLQLQAMVWADYYGRAAIGRIYGTVQPAIVVAGSLGPWLAGYLYDVSGNYAQFFRLGIGLCLLAGLMTLITPRPRATPLARGAAV